MQTTRTLDVYLAEYNARTTRCTYWLSNQVPIWAAPATLLAALRAAWSKTGLDHAHLLAAGMIATRLRFLLWFQTIEEQNLAIQYLPDERRPKVEASVGIFEFWR